MRCSGCCCWQQTAQQVCVTAGHCQCWGGQRPDWDTAGGGRGGGAVCNSSGEQRPVGSMCSCQSSTLSTHEPVFWCWVCNTLPCPSPNSALLSCPAPPIPPSDPDAVCFAFQLPKHHTSSSAGLEDEASSASSTYPVDTPRITPARPVRAAAAAATAAAAQQAPAAGSGSSLSSLRPPGVHPPLPPLAALRAPVAAPVVSNSSSSHAAAADWADGSNSNSVGGGMAGACEMSESFGHDRSFGDSSLELQGLDSPTDRPAADARTAAAAAAASAMRDEASYSSPAASSSSGSSRGGGSRPLSPAEGPSAAEEQREAAVLGDRGVQAAAGQLQLPTLRWVCVSHTAMPAQPAFSHQLRSIHNRQQPTMTTPTCACKEFACTQN